MKNTNKFILSCVFIMATATAGAQFYQVYGYTTLDPSEKELVYWTSYIPSSDHDYDFFWQLGGFIEFVQRAAEVAFQQKFEPVSKGESKEYNY